MECFYRIHINSVKTDFRNFKLVEDNSMIVFKDKKTRKYNTPIKIYAKKIDDTYIDYLNDNEYDTPSCRKDNNLTYAVAIKSSIEYVIDQLYALDYEDRVNYVKAMKKIEKVNAKRR